MMDKKQVMDIANKLPEMIKRWYDKGYIDGFISEECPEQEAKAQPGDRFVTYEHGPTVTITVTLKRPY